VTAGQVTAPQQGQQGPNGPALGAPLPDPEAVADVVEQPGGHVTRRVERGPAVQPVEQRRRKHQRGQR
jgi:hypothetical protein